MGYTKVLALLFVLIASVAWAGDRWDDGNDIRDRDRKEERETWDEVIIEKPNGNAFGTQSGRAYQKSGDGVVDPYTGNYYKKVKGGYINTWTGDFHPSN